MAWTQVYDPLGSPILSTLLAAVPVVLLLGLLATGRVSAPMAALAGLASALAIAVFAYAPDGAPMAEWARTMSAAALNGAAFGLFPIGWIVLGAIFLYTMTVETGHFEIVKHSVASLSDDRRIQALLIAFCFGAFVEGAAGFGTPVAISAALMMGAGFKPLYAAGLALIANTSPVAFGALGTPIITLANVVDRQDPELLQKLSAMAGRQLPFFSLLVPAWLVWTMAGWRATISIWPALLVCGGSFAAVQFAVANFHGPWLVDVVGGLFSLICLALFLRVWKPRQIWRFADEVQDNHRDRETQRHGGGTDSFPVSPRPRVPASAFSAWVPWLLLTLFVFVWGLPDVKQFLGKPSLTVEVPYLHEHIARDYPVVSQRKVEEATFQFNWLSATGTGIFLAAVVSACWLGVNPLRFVRIFVQTCHRMRWPLFTIACMLAIAFTTRYSGMDATLGLAFTKTGWIYPMFAALLGWLGVALTGSDTSSNTPGPEPTIPSERLMPGYAKTQTAG